MILRIFSATVLLAVLGCAANNGYRKSENMTEGERLYRSNCASCHALRKPADYTDDQWSTYVAKYGAKLNLSAGNQKQILDYLQESN